MAAFIEPVMAKLAEQARYWQAYADAFDFRQGELPLSSWQAPAVRTRQHCGAARRPNRRRAGRCQQSSLVARAPSPPGRPCACGVLCRNSVRAVRRGATMRGAARWAGLGGARGGGHTRVFERLTGHWRLPARCAPQATVAVYFTSLVVMKKLVAWRGKSLDAELRGYVLGARFPPPQNAKTQK